MNIICLDTDDCIFPSVAETKWNNADISIRTLEINLQKLRMLIENTNSEVFITSSWYILFDYFGSEKSVVLKDEVREEFKLEINRYNKKAYELIKKYLNGYICGISRGNRDKDIHKLSGDFNNKIVVYDDFDLSIYKSSNCKVFLVNGCLNNDILWDSYNFLKG